MMAGGCEFELLVKGKASHAAQPQNGINALTACVEILQKSLEQEEKLLTTIHSTYYTLALSILAKPSISLLIKLT